MRLCVGLLMIWALVMPGNSAPYEKDNESNDDRPQKNDDKDDDNDDDDKDDDNDDDDHDDGEDREWKKKSTTMKMNVQTTTQYKENHNGSSGIQCLECIDGIMKNLTKPTVT
ncbi:trigger factor [Bufo bufo]|uniref:trigger factor n=1 Tax=Bufo bufo TaxID=8384 RepID=UPI001ABE82EF|nr:trigger factor [Bufo bufo]